MYSRAPIAAVLVALRRMRTPRRQQSLPTNRRRSCVAAARRGELRPQHNRRLLIDYIAGLTHLTSASPCQTQRSLALAQVSCDKEHGWISPPTLSRSRSHPRSVYHESPPLKICTRDHSYKADGCGEVQCNNIWPSWPDSSHPALFLDERQGAIIFQENATANSCGRKTGGG